MVKKWYNDDLMDDVLILVICSVAMKVDVVLRGSDGVYGPCSFRCECA